MRIEKSFLIQRTQGPWSEALGKKRWTFRRLFAGVTEQLVTVEEFRAKLAATQLIIKSDEWQLVLRKYRGSSQGGIDWKRFVTDTEKRVPLEVNSSQLRNLTD
jgi:hypothetical protein